MVDARIRATGPVFDGSFKGLLDDFNRLAVHEVSLDVVSEVTQRQQRAFKRPTGKYWSNMKVSKFPGIAHKNVIHDNGVAYGPWLENSDLGQDPRQAAGSTTFSGYQAWHNGRLAVLKTLPATLSRVAVKAWQGKLTQ